MLNKIKLLFILISSSLIVQGQEIEVIHHISSDQTYPIKINENESLIIYLNFYSPGITNYKALPYFFVNGWYEMDENSEKKNLVGVYRPSNSLVLFAPMDNGPTYLDCIDDTTLNMDTTTYLERFYFPLNARSEKTNKGVWINKNQKTFINNIDFDKKNVCHRVFLKGGDLSRDVNRSIDITDFVISPFGNNDIYLEDYNIKLHSSHKDSLGNSHILLLITNEYVVPSSSSSGGYYYLMLDKYQVIRKNKYLETYNQGKYISYKDDNFSHATKQRFLVIADWSDSQIIGSFIIDKGKIETEKEW